MAQVDDLTAQLDAIRQSVTDATTRVSSDLQSLHDEISKLQGQTSPDLSAALAKVAEIKAAVDAIDAAPAPPPSPPAP